METYDFQSLLSSGRLKDRKAALTIGVFDGTHKGHQKLIERVVDEAEKEKDCISLVITFSINPKPGIPRNIDTIRLREEEIKKMGVNSFVVIDFSPEFSRISASGFIDMLTSLCIPRILVVGEDFRFGNPKDSATAYDLDSMFRLRGAQCRVEIEKAILTEGGEKISSTLVRRVIEKGETGCIPNLTGRKYRIDLMPCPFRLGDGFLEISTKSIHQLLPPPGAYDATLLGRNGVLMDGVCRIERDNLLFSSPQGDPYFLEMEKDGVLPDSIFFGERK